MKKILLTTAIASIALAATATDFSNGTFIVNEDWFGHGNSTVNFFKNGEWSLRVIAEANGGIRRLGATACDGKIYGGDFYLISKQANDGGDADKQGGRLVVVDASTMVLKASLPDIDPNGDKADGRSIVLIDDTKAYVSTSAGVYAFNPVTHATAKVSTIDPSQTGTMLKACGRAFIVNQKKGIYVLNTADDSVIRLFVGTDYAENATFGSIVRSKDGYINASVCNSGGTTLNKILRINPATLETSLIDLGAKGPNAIWGAWTPTTFCGSVQNNYLYWTNGSSVGATGTFVYRFDLDTNTATELINIQPDGEKKYIYGASIRVSPLNDDIYTCQTIGSPYANKVSLYIYDGTGDVKGIYPLPDYYWFPGVPVFTDDAAPVVHEMPVQTISKNDVTRISLSSFVTDDDNLDCDIEKTVTAISNNSVVNKAEIDYSQDLFGELVITPNDTDGEADITIGINSNGKKSTAIIKVKTSGSGVETISTDDNSSPEYFDLNGRRIVGNPSSHGIYIKRQGKTVSKIIL